MKTAAVTMCPCGTKFRHTKKKWSGEFPLSELDGWIEFYRSLCKKRPDIYRADLRALTVFRATAVSA